MKKHFYVRPNSIKFEALCNVKSPVELANLVMFIRIVMDKFK